MRTSRYCNAGLLYTAAATLVAISISGCGLTTSMEDEIKNKNRLLAMKPAEVASLKGEDILKKEEADGEAKGQKEFAGLNFGAGISLTIDSGSNDRINGAQIVSNEQTGESVVRITDEENSVARVMLESHYFFQPATRIWNVKPGNWGVGPFVALQPGTDEIIEAVALGVMIGFKRPDETGTSWNIGIGVVVDPNVQILGDGFVENQAPPVGETQVRFKEKSQVGLLLIASFGF